MDSRRRFLRLLGVFPLGALPFLSWFPHSKKTSITNPSALDGQSFYTVQIFRDGPQRYGYRVTVQNLWEFERRNYFDSPEVAMDEAVKRCMWCWNLDRAV